MYNSLSKSTAIAKFNVSECKRKRRKYINDEKIMAVKVILDLHRTADEIKGCSIHGGQCKEMSGSGTITFGVFIIKRLTDM